MQEFSYHRPVTITELKGHLSQPGARFLAGGTDIIPKMRQGKFSAPVLVDSSGIKSLHFIEDQGAEIVLGALATHQEIADSPLLSNVNPALTSAARSIGCIQTRCRGTLGGNIANASPAADTVPSLLVFDASILIQSLAGERILTLEDFIKGPGETDLQPGEFIHSVMFSALHGKCGSSFIKVGKRNGMTISVVNAAAAVVLDPSGKTIQDVRIAVGSVAPVVIRCRKAEEYLRGKEPGPAAFKGASELSRKEINPITDIRSSGDYRLHSAGVIIRRVLKEAVDQARGKD
jgi:CO/xanthine dehydrogenase FAD-binding subunit